MSPVVRLTLMLQRVAQSLRAATVRRRFDDEERVVLRVDLETLRRERGSGAVIRQWPALIRDGLTDVFTTRQASARDTTSRRLVDLTAAAVVAVPAALLTVPLATAVRLSSRGPAFVTVTYRGLHGRQLRLRKLRTMTIGEKRRVTGLGRLLRASCLDELPSVLQLARGEVTLIGPPAQHNDDTGASLTVRPGLLRPGSSRRVLYSASRRVALLARRL